MAAEPPKGPWWKAPKVDPDAARAAVEQARIEIDDARVTLSMCAGMLTVMARRPPRICDPAAERRVLGWMLSGRCDVAELGELRPGYDFTSDSRRWMAALALELLPVESVLFPGEPMASRCAVYRAIDLAPRELQADVELELWRLPYVVAPPTRELDLVVALARGWSVVDDAYGGAA